MLEFGVQLAEAVNSARWAVMFIIRLSGVRAGKGMTLEIALSDTEGLFSLLSFSTDVCFAPLSTNLYKFKTRIREACDIPDDRILCDM